MKSTNIRGRLAYLDLQRRETGREFFSCTRFADGRRTYRCECHFDDREIVRDVTLTLDPSWRPIDAYVRINHQSRALGAGWFRFGENQVICDALDEHSTRKHLKRAYTGAAPIFGAHPIVNDGLWTALFDRRRSGEMQRFTDCISYSTEIVGRESVGLTTFNVDIRFRGLEDITVPAGSFHCSRFAVHVAGLSAPMDMWIWGDDNLTVKSSREGNPFTYELAELR